MIHSIPYRISSSGSLFSWITKKNMWRCDTHFHKVYTHAYKYINYISCLIISNDCKTFVVQKNNSNSILQIYLCCLRKPFLVIQQHFCAKRLWSGALSHPDGKRWSEPETLKVRLFLILIFGLHAPKCWPNWNKQINVGCSRCPTDHFGVSKFSSVFSRNLTYHFLWFLETHCVPWTRDPDISELTHRWKR